MKTLRTLLVHVMMLALVLVSTISVAGPLGGPLSSSGSGSGSGSTLTSSVIAAKTGVVMDLNPGIASTLTLSGSNVTQAVDAVWGQQVLTQGTAAFVYDNTHLANGHPCITSTNGVSAQSLSTLGYSGNSVLSSPGNWGNQPWSMLVVADVQSLVSLGGGPFIGNQAGATANHAHFGLGGTAFGSAPASSRLWVTQAGVATGPTVSFTTPAPSGPMIASITYDGVRVREMMNGMPDSSDGVALAGGYAIADKGFGLIESYNGAAAGVVRYYRAMWWPYAVPAIQMAQLHRALAMEYGIVTAGTTLIVTTGDSITAGNPPGLSAPQTWPGVMQTALTGTYGKTGITLKNTAVSGTKASGWYYPGGFYTNLTTDSALFAKKIAIVFLGHNDIAVDNTSGADTIQRVQSVAAQWKSMGYDVAVCTIPASSVFTSGNNTARAAFNTWARTVSPYVLIDVDSILQSQNPADTTYYVDGTHPTAALDALIGALAALIIQARF